MTRVAPALQSLGWIPGRLVPVEGTGGPLAHLLDAGGGVDYWLVDGSLYGIAARVEWSNVRANLTLRYHIAGALDPFDTQYRKLLRAMEGGALLPRYIVHAYCPDPDGALHSLCVAEAAAVLRFVEQYHRRNPWALGGWDSPRRCVLKRAARNGPPNYFVAVYWDALRSFDANAVRTWRAGDDVAAQQLRLFA